MNKPTAEQYLKYNDFLGCLDRWENATKRWKEHWFSTCVAIYQKSKKWAKDFVIDLTNKVIARIPHSNIIEWNCKQVFYPQGTELFYLIRAVDKDNNLIFSKVGTTTRSITTRMLEHLKYYKNLGVKRIIIDKVYDCGNIPAECFESYFRAVYIMQYPNTYHKNDRFFGVTFDITQADKIFKKCKRLT